MSQMGSVRVTVTVAVEPEVAFEVFTDEIDQWYRKGVASWGSHNQPIGLRFEPWVGGRLLEDPDVERARLTVWEPPAGLAFVDAKGTEVEVRFTATDDGGTRVVLEHRGLDRLPPGAAADAATFGWRRLLEWFERHMEESKP